MAIVILSFLKSHAIRTAASVIDRFLQIRSFLIHWLVYTKSCKPILNKTEYIGLQRNISTKVTTMQHRKYWQQALD